MPQITGKDREELSDRIKTTEGAHSRRYIFKGNGNRPNGGQRVSPHESTNISSERYRFYTSGIRDLEGPTAFDSLRRKRRRCECRKRCERVRLAPLLWRPIPRWAPDSLDEPAQEFIN